MSAGQPSKCLFLFDIVCPFAYMASHKIAKLEQACNTNVEWVPVALGGLYKSTDAPQGTNSATSILNPTKLRVTSNDFLTQISRTGIKLNYPPAHLRTPQQPQPTLKAMRVLTAVPSTARSVYALAFYKARWVDNVDLTIVSELENVIRAVASPSWNSLGLPSVEAILSDSNIKEELKRQTDLAASRGVFGVPSFIVNDRFYWGSDRMHFVARALGQRDFKPERLQLPLTEAKKKSVTHVNFYFDFSSPWSYLGSTQIEKAIAETGANVKLHFIPILLGALFREIGAPNLPASTLSQAKLEYSRKDFDDWVQYHGVDFVFSPHFPLRTVVPLRVVLAAKKLYSQRYPELIHRLYRATWVEEANIADSTVLESLLDNWGFNGKKLMEYATTPEIKNALIANTKEAETKGCCGVPSFQVDDSPIIWGQDRLDIVQDLICGWVHPLQHSTQKASL